MKKVLLLGDSIRMGYQELVKELLNGEAEVYYPEDNGRFAAYTLWQVNQMYNELGHFDIVHWNNGLWDMSRVEPMKGAMYSIEEYIHYLNRIIDLVESQDTEIIFATTIPIHQDKKTRNNEEVDYYNEVAKQLMNNRKIEVNDLNQLLRKDCEQYICEDLLHLNKEGYLLCAEEVARIVREKL
jgi:hypothetical protein